MREEMKPAIDALLVDLADQEKQVVETKLLINRLCTRSGMEAMFPDAAAAASTGTIGSIRPDSFYGKVLNTAAREYLEMRKAANLGPATPREVYEALVKGGYAPDTKDETNAIISVRATLRKNSSVFHRLPNGTYGLLSWYPNAKPQRDDDEDDAPARPKKKAHKPARKAKGATTTPTADAVPKATRIRNELKVFLANGKKAKSVILKHMIDTGILGGEEDPGANLSTYLSRSKDLVKNDGEGNWSLVAAETGAAA
ncbi:MAG: hypothetical protein JSR60_12875 [Proteobacteria bacterium]|nr:hypothetical protein [Pseudomonadota bacterium]